MNATPRELLRQLARQTIPPEPAEVMIGRRLRVVQRLERFGAAMLSKALGAPVRQRAMAGPPAEN